MNADWQQKLDSAIDARQQQLIAVRRHLHTHPELSGQEHETSLYLYQMLSDAGFNVRMGPDGRGLLVDSRDNTQAPCIALRADIDALPIHDEKNVTYRSQHDGVMHACGHDAHAAVVLGALTALDDLRTEGDLPWPIRVRGLFQPSEETATGAAEMVEAGALEGVDAILAVHVDPSRSVGRIGIRTGILTANCDAMRVSIIGRGGHAARPHEAIDPIATAAQLISSLYLSIPRVTDSQDAVMVRVIPDVAFLVEIHRLRRRQRCFLAEVERRRFAVRAVVDEEAAAADVACGGPGNGHGEGRRYSGIDGVATLLQNLDADLRRDAGGRGDDPVLAAYRVTAGCRVGDGAEEEKRRERRDKEVTNASLFHVD